MLYVYILSHKYISILILTNKYNEIHMHGHVYKYAHLSETRMYHKYLYEDGTMYITHKPNVAFPVCT